MTLAAATRPGIGLDAVFAILLLVLAQKAFLADLGCTSPLQKDACFRTLT